MGPDLVDLIELWLKDHASAFYIERWDECGRANYPAAHLGLICRKGFGSCVTIHKDYVSINYDSRNPDGFIVMAADPKFFDLLSNRLYIMEQGFKKAENSRIETAKRDLEKGTINVKSP